MDCKLWIGLAERALAVNVILSDTLVFKLMMSAVAMISNFDINIFDTRGSKWLPLTDWMADVVIGPGKKE